MLLCVLYYIMDKKDYTKQNHSLLLIALVMSTLVTIAQQLGIVSMLTVKWPGPLMDLFSFIMLINFDIEFLNVDCLADTSALSRFLLKVFIVCFGVVIVVVIHIFYVLMFHHRDFRGKMPTLIGMIGTLFTVFYISMVSAVLAPFQCLLNPNGLWTIRGYQSVICWETSEHHMMLGSGIAALLLPLAFLIKCALVVLQFPEEMRKAGLLIWARRTNWCCQKKNKRMLKQWRLYRVVIARMCLK